MLLFLISYSSFVLVVCSLDVADVQKVAAASEKNYVNAINMRVRDKSLRDKLGKLV